MKRPRTSAGLLMFRRKEGQLEVLLAHPGGPYSARKDDGFWTIPKGEPEEEGEDLLARARIEFEEEVGVPAVGDWLPIGSITQKGGKVVHGWAFEGDLPETFQHRSNAFEMEWPPHSGKIQPFPEIDRVAFFSVPEALHKIKDAQAPFLDRLVAIMTGI
ncbi:MAG: NUDIX hydrolase [Chthoniobacterales bacterium]